MILEDLNHISYVYIAVFCSETFNRSFVFPIGFFSKNGRMLTWIKGQLNLEVRATHPNGAFY